MTNSLVYNVQHCRVEVTDVFTSFSHQLSDTIRKKRVFEIYLSVKGPVAESRGLCISFVKRLFSSITPDNPHTNTLTT